jgi:phosphoenolpyruvate synthase/pyruvate phosphate dikinase
MVIQWEPLWKREYSFFYGHACVISEQTAVQKVLGRSADVRAEKQGKWFQTFIQIDIREPYMKEVAQQIQNNKGAVEKMTQSMHANGQAFVRFVKKLPELTSKSDKELIKFYQEFYDFYLVYCLDLWLSFDYVEAASVLFEELAKKLDKEDPTRVLTIFSEPTEKAAVLTIADYFKLQQDRNKRIQFIKENYPWLGSIDPFAPPMTKKQMEEYVDSFTIPPDHEKKHFYTLNPSQQHIVECYQKMLFVKDKRDEYRRMAFYYIRPLLQEIASRLKISIEELGYFLPWDLDKTFADLTWLVSELRERKKGIVITYINKKENLLVGEKAVAKFLVYDTAVTNKITGKKCSSGLVQGTVQIIHNIADLENFKEGNVLIAITTAADYVPAMQKACAFVTDEGGIACHAAIVAREMKKPCVVGTRDATKIFKDGDFVEVNADTGVVRLLEGQLDGRK